MKNVILLEVAAQWERDAEMPNDTELMEDSEAARIKSSIAAGQREAKRECADLLRMLVDVFCE